VTSPCEEVTIRCPQCGNEYRDWFRASVNLSLGEDFDEDYLRSCETATCPACHTTVEIGPTLVISWD
jgi:uncharacterized protein with PIN domain